MSKAKRTRLARLLAGTLLVAVPAGYFAIAAQDSHASGERKRATASVSGLQPGKPTVTQRRIYRLPIPPACTYAQYFETNSWSSSSLYARFATTPGGLDEFLRILGSSRDALVRDWIPISDAQARVVGWQFGGAFGQTRDLAGLHLDGDGAPQPRYDMVVNLTNDQSPIIYVVSTIDFANPSEGG